MNNAIDLDRLNRVSFIRRVDYHPVLGSTNDHARALAHEQAADGALLVLAEAQTAGRGRGANRWWTGAGSLAFSLLFHPGSLGIDRRYSPQLALLAAVAAVDIVRPLLAGREVGLHWPNDVYVAGCKLAGVLVEALPDGRHILGMGLNVNNSLDGAPPDVQRRATTLYELAGRQFDRTEVLVLLLDRLQELLGRLAADPIAVGGRYDDLCLQRGRTLTIQTPATATTGRCAGIATDGALLLETATGIQKFYGGVVVNG